MSGLTTLWSEDQKLVGPLPELGQVVDILLKSDYDCSSTITLRCIFLELHGLKPEAQPIFVEQTNRLYFLKEVSGWRLAQSLINDDIVE